MGTLLPRILAFVAVAAAFALVLRTSPTNEVATLREFHIFTPLILVLGFAGLFKGAYHAWRSDWRRDYTEGLIAFSVLAIALGNDFSWAAIRRAAERFGYDAEWMLHSDYRVFSAGLLVIATLLVLRWATRREFAAQWKWPQYLEREIAGEIPWVTIAVSWMIFVSYQSVEMSRILAWIYTLL